MGDINTMSLKDLRRDLEKKFDLPELSMDHRKTEIQALAVEELQRIAAGDEETQENLDAAKSANGQSRPDKKRKREEDGDKEKPVSKANVANKDTGMTKGRFEKKAETITIPKGIISSNPIKIGPKQFSTGSSG